MLEGVRQSEVVTAALERKPELVAHLLAGRRNVPVSRVQPVVITNVHYFNGWHPRGVSVVSTGGLNSIFRGARIDSYTTEGETKVLIGSDSLIGGAEPTTEEFLRPLREAVDWRDATETADVQHHPVHVGGVQFRYPELRHRSPLLPPPSYVVG